ncbi:MAG TPA: PAS domain S-box protein [Actinomycetota bacterium]|nr:PAS domain S-box protein [Actinomycetota bacterium]
MKRRARTHAGMGRLMAVLVVLAMVPLGLLAYSTVRLSTGAVKDEVKARMRSAASLSAGALQKEIQGVAEVVESYAARPTLVAALSDHTQYDLPEIQNQLAELAGARPGIAATFVADPQGKLIDIVPPTPSIVGQDFTYRDWYRGVSATGRTYISTGYMSLATDHPLVVGVATFVRTSGDGTSQGGQLAILVAAYGLDEIQGFVDKYDAFQGVSVTVTDQRGFVLASPGGGQALTSRATDPLVAAALKGKSAVATVRGPSGRLLSAYEPVPELDWTVTASVPERVALARVTHLRSGVVLVAAILAMVLAVGLLLLARALRARAHAEADEARLAAIVESFDDAIIGITLDGVITSWNLGAERLYWYTADEVVGQDISILAPPDRKEEVARNLERIREGRRIEQFETVRVTKDGTPRDVSITSSFVRDRNGNVDGASVIAQDITDRKRMEDAVRESEQRYRLLVENAPDMVFTVSPEGLVTSLNSGFETITGWKREDWIGKDFAPLLHPDDLDASRNRTARMLRGEQLPPSQVRIRTSSGAWRNLESVSSPLAKDGSVVQIVGIARDVTERKVAEDALRASEERTRLIIETASDAVVGMDTNGRITDWNRQAESTFGWSREEAIGRVLADTIVPPQYREAHASGLERFLQTGQGPVLNRRVELAALHREGREFPVELTVCPVQWGPTLGFTAFVRDITERKQAEEQLRRARNEAERAKEEAEQAKEEAERANRAKSEFLSRMSHELRTPLNAVLGFGQLLEMDSLNEEQQESVAQILKGGRHLLDLINEVLDIARIEVGRIALSLEPVAVDESVLGAVDLIRPLATERGIRLGTEISESSGYVTADRQRLKQVLLNLLSNAVKYNRAGGSVAVRCVPAPGGWARVEVADDGPGIAPEYMSRLFVPFERLGAENSGVEGTGLGLALSKRLVEVMGGTLEVDSTPGRGSTFSVSLPGAEGPESRLERGGSKGLVLAALNGEGTILHIEDNPANLKLIERILSGLRGVKLLSAMQGSLGLDMARQHRPDVILLDLNLPDIQGQEVLGLLRADPRTRDIPVLVVSADATPEQLRNLRAAGAKAYLTKPLDVQRFLHVVDEALKERRLDHAG